jgi:hypothetical protein
MKRGALELLLVVSRKNRVMPTVTAMARIAIAT